MRIQNLVNQVWVFGNGGGIEREKKFVILKDHRSRRPIRKQMVKIHTALPIHSKQIGAVSTRAQLGVRKQAAQIIAGKLDPEDAEHLIVLGAQRHRIGDHIQIAAAEPERRAPVGQLLIGKLGIMKCRIIGLIKIVVIGNGGRIAKPEGGVPTAADRDPGSVHDRGRAAFNGQIRVVRFLLQRVQVTQIKPRTEKIRGFPDIRRPVEHQKST